MVARAAGRVCVVVADDAVAADGVGARFCRLVPRRLRSARGGGGTAGADEADDDDAAADDAAADDAAADDEAAEDEEDEEDATAAEVEGDDDALAAARPQRSMTVSNLVVNSSSDNCVPLTLNRMSDTLWRCL
jgi:hypothetical protein